MNWLYSIKSRYDRYQGLQFARRCAKTAKYRKDERVEAYHRLEKAIYESDKSVKELCEMAHDVSPGLGSVDLIWNMAEAAVYLRHA